MCIFLRRRSFVGVLLIFFVVQKSKPDKRGKERREKRRENPNKGRGRVMEI
jgi:hypothetical protein